MVRPDEFYASHFCHFSLVNTYRKHFFLKTPSTYCFVEDLNTVHSLTHSHTPSSLSKSIYFGKIWITFLITKKHFSNTFELLVNSSRGILLNISLELNYLEPFDSIPFSCTNKYAQKCVIRMSIHTFQQNIPSRDICPLESQVWVLLFPPPVNLCCWCPYHFSSLNMFHKCSKLK